MSATTRRWTHTVYFIQYQGEQPDFSDGRTDQQLYQSLDAALEGFSSTHGQPMRHGAAHRLTPSQVNQSVNARWN